MSFRDIKRAINLPDRKSTSSTSDASGTIQLADIARPARLTPAYFACVPTSRYIIRYTACWFSNSVLIRPVSACVGRATRQQPVARQKEIIRDEQLIAYRRPPVGHRPNAAKYSPHDYDDGCSSSLVRSEWVRALARAGDHHFWPRHHQVACRQCWCWWAISMWWQK